MPHFVPHESSFAFLVAYNSGRGGDTCTTQNAYSSGPFNGLSRGLLDRLQGTVINQAYAAGANVISVLIGINDINQYSVPQSTVVSCITSIWSQLTSQGFQVRALTYPPVSAINTVFPNPAASSQATVLLNAAIRNAVSSFNAAYGGPFPVKLVDMESAYVDTCSNTNNQLVCSMTVDGVHPNSSGAQKMALVCFQTP